MDNALPSWLIPLSDEDQARLGRIVVMWGQVESVLDYIIQAFTPIDEAAYKSLLGGRMLSTKVGIVLNLAKEITNLRTMKACEELCSLINASSSDRNDAVHGRWGYSAEAGEPVAQSSKRNKLFKLEMLHKLEQDSIAITRAAVEVIQACAGRRGVRHHEQIRMEIPKPAASLGTGRALPHWPSHWIVHERPEPSPPHQPLRELP